MFKHAKEFKRLKDLGFFEKKPVKPYISVGEDDRDDNPPQWQGYALRQRNNKLTTESINQTFKKRRRV